MGVLAGIFIFGILLVYLWATLSNIGIGIIDHKLKKGQDNEDKPVDQQEEN